MKKCDNKLNLLVLVFLITLFITSLSFSQLVTNGGFEDSNVGTSSNIAGWFMQSGGSVDPKPVFEITADVVHNGDRALMISIDGVGSNQWDIQAVAEHIPVTPGATYTYEIWAKAEESGAQANFTVGNYSYQEYSGIRGKEITTEWQKFTMEFTIDDDETDSRAPIHLNFDANVGNIIYIDDLSVIDVAYGKTPITVQAEDGDLGDDFVTEQDGDNSFITTSVNFSGSDSPEDESRVATFDVTFQDSGYYDLFARIRVGSGGYDDDSFFLANGFDYKDVTDANEWVMVNGLAGGGFVSDDDVVRESGSAGNSVWKWVNVSKNFHGNDLAESFFVDSDELVQTFQIASREDGLDIDKIAFGKSNLYYTVKMLDNELPGSETYPEPDTTYAYPGPPLGEGADKFLGSVMSIGDTSYSNFWNQLTPGNAGKWASVAGASPDTNRWNWSNLDYFYNYCKENEILFKNHTLIWGSQQPGWINEMEPAKQLDYIEMWIKMVGQRYPDMAITDVVNEPLRTHNPPDGNNNRANYKEALGGDGETGYDWVIKSFELARKYLPNTELILNDYGIINDNGATALYLRIINLLKDRGLIDAIGVQGHRFALEKAPVSTLKNNLDRLAETGLPVYISELDLGNIGNAGDPDDDEQLELYQKIFPVLWEHPGVRGITLWGFREGHMWQTSCHLVNKNGTWRPAMQWLAQYVQDHKTDVTDFASNNPTNFTLEQNYPNPFNPTTTIHYKISTLTQVTLKIFDITGREIQTLVNEIQEPGQYNMTFNAQHLATGVYFYTLNADSFSETRKFLLIK